MIAIGEEVPAESKIKPVPRQVQWNADAAIKCNLAYEPNAEGRENKMRSEEVVRFSCSAPVLLGSFVCGQVFNEQNLEQTIETPVKVQIFERATASEPMGPNSESVLILESNTTLKSDADTVVSLDKPLIIWLHLQISVKNRNCAN